MKEKKDIMITINAIGDTCPIPVVKTKKAIEKLENRIRLRLLLIMRLPLKILKRWLHRWDLQFQTAR